MAARRAGCHGAVRTVSARDAAYSLVLQRGAASFARWPRGIIRHSHGTPTYPQEDSAR